LKILKICWGSSFIRTSFYVLNANFSSLRSPQHLM
jgi:hypothetical protein